MLLLCQWVTKWFVAVDEKMVKRCVVAWRTLQGNVLNWLGIVVDSVKGGSKNGSSRPVRRGTMPGKIINWLGVVVDFASSG
jgi:hypothetical protein